MRKFVVAGSVGEVGVLRSPNAWPDAQAAFHRAFAAGDRSQPTRPVTVAWYRRGFDDGWSENEPECWVAIFEAGATAEAEPVMVFPVDQVLEPPVGTASAVLVGEVGLNAVCCVEVNGVVLWPTYNPVPKKWRVPRAASTSASPTAVSARPRYRFTDQQRSAVVAMTVAGVVLYLLVRVTNGFVSGLALIGLVIALAIRAVLGRRWRREASPTATGPAQRGP